METVTNLVGEFSKMGMKRENGGERRGLREGSCQELTGNRASAEQPGGGPVSPDSTLEFANHLFRAIAGTENAHIDIESHIALPVAEETCARSKTHVTLIEHAHFSIQTSRENQ